MDNLEQLARNICKERGIDPDGGEPIITESDGANCGAVGYTVNWEKVAKEIKANGDNDNPPTSFGYHGGRQNPPLSLWQEIGVKIQNHRVERDMTQQELGDKIDTSPQFISNLENGSKRCSVDKLNEIVKALGYKMGIMFNEVKQKY